MLKRLLFVAVFGLLVLLAASPALASPGPEYYTLTVPGTVAIASMPPITGGASANQTVSAATDNLSKTYASVVVSGSNAGKLTLGGTSLSPALSLSGDGFTTVSLTGDPQTLVTVAQGALSEVGSEKKWTKALVITQPPYLWVTAGAYTCTITFTATFGP